MVSVIIKKWARVAKLVDAIDLGSIAVRCVGSSPTSGTTVQHNVPSMFDRFDYRNVFVSIRTSCNIQI